MKKFIKISENTIVNINNVIKIVKTEINVNDKIVYSIRYYITNLTSDIQRFNSKEERDNFFRNLCSDLMY